MGLSDLFNWAAIAFGLACLGCEFVMLWHLNRRNEHAIFFVVLLGFGPFCVGGLTGLLYGWVKARAWGIRRFMTVWTAMEVSAIACFALSVWLAPLAPVR